MEKQTTERGWRGTLSRRETMAGLGSAAFAGIAGCASPSSESEPRIVAPETALIDEDLGLRIEGLDPGTTVEFRGGMEFGEGKFGSRAVFEADSDGVVDLAESAPIEGTYDRVSPMGPVWSMRALGKLDDPGPSFRDDESTDGTETRFWAFVDDEEVASTTVVRRPGPEGVTTVQPETESLVGRCYLPPGDGPHPGVLVLHGSSGNTADGPAEQLAAHGFAAFALSYVGPEDPIPDEFERVPLEYFDRAVQWLRGRDETTDGPVGSVGSSMGGQASMLIGARRDDVGVVVNYSGRPHVTRMASRGEPFWIADGEPVPAVEVDQRADGEVRSQNGVSGYATRPAFEKMLEETDESALESAMIEVESIDGPVLYIAGEDDAWASSPTEARDVMARLDAADHPYSHEALVYENAGHSIRPPYVPTARAMVTIRGGSRRLLGGTPSGYARANADSWPTVLSYLERGLDG